MDRAAIVRKVQAMFIQAQPELADRNYRIKMNRVAKLNLVRQMVDVANKIAIFNK